MALQRFACFNLSIADQLKAFDIHTYSLFKYGSAAANSYFADRINQLLAAKIPNLNDGSWCIASAAYKQIPTASYFLTKSFIEKSNIENEMQQVRITRDIVYADDYAQLNVDARLAKISQIKLNFSKEQIKGKNLLIIDDALVTGSHEKILFDQVSPFVKSICFAYIVDIKDLNSATLESSMNNAAVQYLTDLEDIIDQGNYNLNARTVKYLLGYPNPIHFNYFLMRRKPDFVADLSQAAYMDEYALMPEFSRNMQLLKSYHNKIMKAQMELSLSE